MEDNTTKTIYKQDIIKQLDEGGIYENIGIICNYGKHRSVAWAELLKKLYYPKSNIKHIGI